MIRRRLEGRWGDRGAVLVEFALVAPILFALLLGVFTGGISLSRQNSMKNAVREGSRLGATLPSDATWADSVRNRVVELAGGDLGTDQVCVALVYKLDAMDTTGTDVHAPSCSIPVSKVPPPQLPAGTAVDDCVVKVWAYRTSELETVFWSRDLDLKASSVSRYERGVGPACA